MIVVVVLLFAFLFIFWTTHLIVFELVIYLGLSCAASILFFLVFKQPRVSIGDNRRSFFRNLQVGAHRGSHHDLIPENSMSSYIAAKNEGAQLIEIDIRLTCDKVPVISHDDNLLKSTGHDVNISKITYSHFQNLCFRGTNEHLPSFMEVVNWAHANKMRMIWEIKVQDETTVALFDDLIRQKNLHSTVIVCSFNPFYLYRVKQKNPEILTGYIWRSHILYSQDIDGTIPRSSSALVSVFRMIADRVLKMIVQSYFLPLFLGNDMLLYGINDINRNFLISARRWGFEVVAWQTNDKTEMNYYLRTLNVPFLTDDVRNFPL